MRMETSDEDLVRAAVQGDAQAFQILINRHYDLIFRLAFKTFGNRADAEDLAQDICTRLPHKLCSFRAEARFTTWLYRVTLNAATDRLRSRQTRARANNNWGEVEQMQRAETAEKQAELDWLNRAMTHLPDDLRQTVALVLGEDLTHAVAAGVLGISECTVSWRMSEVKRILRAMAKEQERIE
jgi:RNA polymerase sigma-70 factor, ECF subfamily